MYLVVFYVGEYVWVCGCVGVYTKSKTSELSPLRRKLLRFAPLRSKKIKTIINSADLQWNIPRALSCWLYSMFLPASQDAGNRVTL
jgi:hypothetical protein